MPTIILTTFARRDASERELAAESASQNAATMEQESEPHVKCRGLLRAHLHGASLEILLAFQKLGAKRGGIVWAGPGWIAKQQICSEFWARERLKQLVRDGWLSRIEWNGRKAFRVLSHAEWALATGRCDAGISQQSCATAARKLREPRNSQSPMYLECKSFSAARSAPEDQNKQYQRTSYFPGERSAILKNNITAKIAKQNSSWAAFLQSESDEKYRIDVRKKFAFVCKFLGWEIDENDGALHWEFALTLIEKYAEHRDSLRSGLLTRATFACKVIDTCERNGILWPPAFTELRDRLRQIERHSEVNSTLEAANANRSHR